MIKIIKKITSHNIKQEIHDSWIWLTGLLGKIFGFVFLITLIFIIYFVIGNFQNFLDQTQIVLINIISVLTLLNFLVGVFYLVCLFFDSFRQRKGRIIRLILAFFLSFVMLLLTLFFKFFTAWFHF
ncbi:MAG: hypothetical protein JXR70_10000 [Spirochaetales bacterium]|nr:hypothetical protein [Spirochaetales bacterium]